ncbi:MAG: hypothetical protein RMM31_08735 [Anaerolineae bacterium]|nr:hypothetical protein [Thermoflexales bacterium]MDW8396314.1 hypothetical protein [Anaerolineae bacterium]
MLIEDPPAHTSSRQSCQNAEREARPEAIRDGHFSLTSNDLVFKQAALCPATR